MYEPPAYPVVAASAPSENAIECRMNEPPAVAASAPYYNDSVMMDQPPAYPAVVASASYHDAPQTPQTSIVIVPRILYGPNPMRVTCVCCHQQVQTTTVTVYGICTWTAVLVLVFLCFCFAWVPLYIDSLKDIHHYCPSCSTLLGVYQKSETLRRNREDIHGYY
ncbi:lipopolysaccharide-induced tumor necrosis factor-alpha factor homolog [Parasteatoda tepidariorum]|uniref:lipopolysaccharide-induced tumor necrosis factor-alpha factor homolog n=1 Tax=Parasteatoda tepidariorum TaxID=114398 RepID=UPI0039BD3874